jgi:hypothetical protein
MTPGASTPVAGTIGTFTPGIIAIPAPLDTLTEGS